MSETLTCKVCSYSGLLRCWHQMTDREHAEAIEGFVPDDVRTCEVLKEADDA